MNVYEPINIPAPPKHTQVTPRCLNCTSFEVCNIRDDYFKTLKLIQNILGDPQDDFELREEDGTFHGIPFPDDQTYFPLEFEVSEEITAHYLSSKYVNKNLVRVLYEINKFYYQFIIFWIDTGKYEVSEGRELYYGLTYQMPQEIADQISTNLLDWRSEMEQREAERREGEIINTTFFSAILNCQFYQLDKNLTSQQKLERMNLHCGHPGHYHHIATYHYEPNKVISYDTEFSPIPVLYPVFIPKDKEKHKPKPPKRRDDLNGI